jgi:hypothetical protein
MQTTLSKGDFAKRIGVSPGRVSQYIAAGMIGPSALDGEGRNAKVIVAAAVEQIRQRRDIGQSLGNGLSTKLDLEPEESGGEREPAAERTSGDGGGTKTPTVDDEIKQERLQAERRRNRVAAQDEALRLGHLVEGVRVKAEMTKLARSIDDEYAAMLQDFAEAITAQFHVPQRDVLHLLRRVRIDKKAAAAERARRRAAGLPEMVEAIVEEHAA